MAEAEKACPHSFLGDRLHLPRRDALDPPVRLRRRRAGSHLGQARHERLLGALVALERLGREAPVPVLRHPQLRLADPGHQRPAVVARAVAEPAGAALALGGTQRVGHLGLQHLLQHRAHDLAQPDA